MFQLIGLVVTLIFLIIALACNILNISTSNADYLGASDKIPNYEKIQNKVLLDYKKLIPKKKLTFNDFCYPEKYTVQPQQKFAGDFMKPDKTPRELLVFHKIGAGKTCLSIQICEQWTSRGKPLVLMPASLIPGFRNELRSKCAGINYLSDSSRDELKTLSPNNPRYIEIINDSNEKIDSKYNILSYNKFLTDADIDAPIIVVDEVQNINNLTGKFFKAILNWIENHPAASVVIMSGTPLFDSPNELYGLAKLLRIEIPDDKKRLESKDVKDLFAGKITYFQGAPKFTYPTADLKIVQCEMSRFQTRWYKSEVEAEMKKYQSNDIIDQPIKELIKYNKVSNDFYIKSRQRSNVVYPEGTVGTVGISLMTNSHLTTNLSTYSVKCAKMMKKLAKMQLSFIYSGFTGYGGIKFIIKVLEAHGYVDFLKHGPGTKRYAIWSGDQNNKQKDTIRATFNASNNDDASKLQIVIGSPSIKEGVTLLRTRQVHVMESYWNHSRLEQIFGRAVRYCSHKSLPRSERDVKIYIYAATTKHVSPSKLATVAPDVSIDLYMLNIADQKRILCSKYLDAMIDCAVDKYLWR